jgi:hypothetical protein
VKQVRVTYQDFPPKHGGQGFTAANITIVADGSALTNICLYLPWQKRLPSLVELSQESACVWCEGRGVIDLVERGDGSGGPCQRCNGMGVSREAQDRAYEEGERRG